MFPVRARQFAAIVPVVVRLTVMLLGLAAQAQAASVLNPIFQDHTVLQRDKPITVWGSAAPGEEVTVSLGSAAITTRTTSPSGHWTAVLPAMPAGGPYDLTARLASGTSQTAHDVLIGDVFLCSGQSNMVLPVHRTLNSRVEILEGNNDTIRMLTVPLTTSMTPLETFAEPVKWQPATSATVPEFSASCYYFARELQKAVHVPLGLINSAWGGTLIQPWMSDSALHTIGGYDRELELFHEFASDPQAASQHWGTVWESWWRDHMHTEPWRAAPETADWRLAPTPLVYWELWGVPELANFDGLMWYRTTVTLTARQAAQPATLTLGAIDQVEATWLNGHWLGTTSGSNKERTYTVPSRTLKKGQNTITVNVLDTYSYGGIYGPAEKRALHLADGTVVPLDQEWRYQVVPSSIGPAIRAPWEDVAGVTLIRNAMIAPLGSYGLRGIIWYQGESNADDAPHYKPLLNGLMADWRSQFGSDLPFLVVQLANYGSASTAPAASDWATLREAQRLIVAEDAHAGLAVAIDIGERTDIHPANKQELGRRLARAARHVVYGESIAPSGPVPVAAHKDGEHVVVTFKDITGGLVAYGAYRPLGFELCATDQASCRFVDATLQPDRVVLDPMPGAPAPTRVRFCWADSPVCTLYDKSGLPAGPFEMPIS
jgi:sialate O-acetylesterase